MSSSRASWYVVGHRGAAGLAPENTLASFQLAIELGVDAVECDVHRSADGRLVVMHDADVARTTNGHGAIAELTYAQLATLDAGDGQRIPTLEEVLALVAGQVDLVCELKGAGSEAAASVVDGWPSARVCFISFDQQRLTAVRASHPHAQLSALFDQPQAADLRRAAAIPVSGVDLEHRMMTGDLLRLAGELELEVRCWTPNARADFQRLADLGVRSVTTDRPDLLLSYVQEARHR